MNITKSQLKQIIKEELETTILNENALPDARDIAANPELIKQLFQLVPQVVSWVTGANMHGMMQASLEDLYDRTKREQ
jgi:hypothetical protein